MHISKKYLGYIFIGGALTAAFTISSGQVPPHKKGRPLATQPTPIRPASPLSAPAAGVVNVDITSSHVLSRFVPNLAFGAGVDAIGTGSLPSLLSPINVSRMLTAGHGALSYRLYTELNVQDWHWNPTGTWSDGQNKQGYFVGNSTPQRVITESHGYALAHRGATYDFGSNLEYSNLTDGNSTSYWKSNPYLSSTYTKDPDSAHPQWAFVDFGTNKAVNAIKIQWANPFAVAFQVQYWTGDDPLYDPTNGNWTTFPNGSITNGTGGTTSLVLSKTPIQVQYVRVLMTQSSNTFDSHGSSDPRNGLGYAIYEISIGSVNASGTFTDLVHHSADQNQTVVYVSSNDPWHKQSAMVTDTEQSGLDYILQSSIAKRLPTLVPVPVLYSTPENAVAEIAYLIKRKYPLLGIELGEEADGQWMTPEDYAALYLQWATAIHAAFPNIRTGGPVASYNGVQTWTDGNGETDYLKRFYAYLKAHGSTSELNFVSMEHYPFYQAGMDWSLIQQEVAQVKSIFTWVANAGIPKTIPIYISEYNLSAAPDQPIVDLMGALWHAVFVGEFMNGGGAGSYYYQYLPYEVSSGGTSFGLIGMFAGDGVNRILSSTSQFFSSQLICKEWCYPGGQAHSVLPAKSTIVDSAGTEHVLPYAVARPDGQYAVMLVNTDSVTHTVTVAFNDTKTHAFTGTVVQAQFSSKDYVWQSNGSNGKASPDGPLEHAKLSGGAKVSYTLPAHSITVLRAKIL